MHTWEREGGILKSSDWILIDEQFPPEEDYILLSLDNFSIPIIGRYQDGSFYEGDDIVPLLSHDLFVNAWMPLPEPYRD